MAVDTIYESQLQTEAMYNYLTVLVNRIFKILPIREQEEDSLSTYLQSLLAEVLGCGCLVCEMKNDPDYIILVSVLQYLADHAGIEVKQVRREVFKAISICNKLKSNYCTGGEN